MLEFKISDKPRKKGMKVRSFMSNLYELHHQWLYTTASADNAQNLFQLRLQSIFDKLINALRHEGSAEWNNLTEPAGTHAVYSINLLVNVRIFCSPLCTSNSDSSIPLHHTAPCSTGLTLLLVPSLGLPSVWVFLLLWLVWGVFFPWPFSPRSSSTHAK